MAAFIGKASAMQTADPSERLCYSRIIQLFDEDSFVSMDNQVVSRSFSESFDRPKVEGDGVVTGYGTIDGRLVFAASQDPDVYGGSIGRSHAMKIVKVVGMAISSGAPFVALYSSGGARIEEGVLALEGLGAVLSALTQAKGRIPLISAILGPCPGGVALAAVQSDFILFGSETSRMYMNSPAVTAAQSGDAVQPSEIGTPLTHQKETGLASFVLNSDEECMQKIRQIFEYISVSTGDTVSFVREMDPQDDPNRISGKLNDMASDIDDDGLDIRMIFSEISDRQTYLEISEGYGTDMVIALTKLDGISVGLIGNADLRMTESGAKKTAKFVRFCTNFRIPVITFTNAEGFVVGTDIEKSGIIEAAAELICAFSESDIPRISVLSGMAIGSAYLSLNSRMLGADAVFAWPTAQVAIMTADSAANILFRKEIAASPDPIAARIEKVAAYREQISDPQIAAGYGQIDEIILPSVTRPRIISALDILLCAYPLIEKSTQP